MVKGLLLSIRIATDRKNRTQEDLRPGSATNTRALAGNFDFDRFCDRMEMKLTVMRKLRDSRGQH